MKRFLMLLMVPLLLLGACKSKNKELQKVETVVEQTIASDRSYMCQNYGCVYKWYETDIVLNEYLDDEDCTGSVFSVTNVFQVVNEYEGGSSFDTKVIMITHTADGMQVKEIEGFWVEDFAMDSTDANISFKQAWYRICAANHVKPHSRNCVLRKQIGPISCHAQYIFGNVHSQLYVDAITGEVRDTNPAFEPLE